MANGGRVSCAFSSPVFLWCTSGFVASALSRNQPPICSTFTRKLVFERRFSCSFSVYECRHCFL